MTQDKETRPQTGTALSRRVMPHHIEAEQAVIGGVLFYPKKFSEVSELLQPDDFYHDALRAIFAAMVELDEQSVPIDLITVAERMRQNQTFSKLHAYQGEAYLADLASQVATVENLTHYASLVRDKATARRLIEGAMRVVDKGYTETDVETYIDEAQQIMFDVAHRANRQTYEPVRSILRHTITGLEQRYARKEAITGVPTGYAKFDRLTTGLQPGELIIVAARPSMGKTAFAINCAQHASMKGKIPVLVFSLEMSKESLIERVLASEARIDSQRLRSGFLETRDWMNLTKAASVVSEAPMWIDDSGSPTLMEIRARCRRWRNDARVFPAGLKQPGLIVIDYLQLVQGRAYAKENSREREISEISRGLKALAKELAVPVMALSQLNRSVESRADKRPMASDLRESGAIEQDADLICFIYRDEVYNKETNDKGIAELIIGKQRNGPTGTVRLSFLHQYTRFDNLAEE